MCVWEGVRTRQRDRESAVWPTSVHVGMNNCNPAPLHAYHCECMPMQYYINVHPVCTSLTLTISCPHGHERFNPHWRDDDDSPADIAVQLISIYSSALVPSYQALYKRSFLHINAKVSPMEPGVWFLRKLLEHSCFSY